MSTVKSETRTPVTDVSYFKPNKERDDVVTSLEEWAAQLLKPDITDILKVAKKNSNTKIRFRCAKKPTNFQLTDMNYTTTGNKVCDEKPTYPCSPDKNSDETTNELLLNISSVIKSALTSVQKKRNNSKRLSHGAINKLQTTHEGASSLIALANQRHRTNFRKLEEMHVHLQTKAEGAENKQKRTCLNIQSLELDSGSALVNESESESDLVFWQTQS
jgi:hypothetical protein